MTITEAAKELNRAFKEDNNLIYKLEEKIDELEKIIKNLADRIDYLEKRCN